MTATCSARTPHRTPPTGGARALRVGIARGGLEVRQFFRDKAQVVFTFSLPVVMLLLFASIFTGDVEGTNTTYQQVYVTGMLAVGIMSSSFQALAIQVAAERHNGALKRLRGTPMPAVSYFLGKTVQVLVASIGQTVVMLVIGALFFDLELPSGLSRWLTFGWVFVLGITACTLIGLAYSGFIRGQNGTALIILPFIVLEFISGVFIVFHQLPEWLQTVAAVFPLKWLCQGMRSVFLPDSFAVLEPAGTWEHGAIALALGGWVAIGLVLCLLTFRWKNSD